MVTVLRLPDENTKRRPTLQERDGGWEWGRVSLVGTGTRGDRLKGGKEKGSGKERLVLTEGRDYLYWVLLF